MKKLTYSLFLFALAGAVMIGCKKTEKLPKGEKEVNIPCSGPDYFTNKSFFRANSLGESLDLRVSKEKAMTNARAELAASIQSTVKTVTDNYVNSREMNNKEDLEERFEQLNRTIVDQTLSGIKMICEKQVQTDGGKGGYRTYVAIELSASDIVQKYNENLSKDERLKIDYDYEKFKETFDKEMEKMSNK
jgi:hypothetical protein